MVAWRVGSGFWGCDLDSFLETSTKASTCVVKNFAWDMEVHVPPTPLFLAMTVRASCKFKESAVVSLFVTCCTVRVLHMWKCLMPNVAKSPSFGPFSFISLQGLCRGAGAFNRKRNLQKAYAHFSNLFPICRYNSVTKTTPIVLVSVQK